MACFEDIIKAAQAARKKTVKLITQEMVDDSTKELQQKTEKDIEKETAIKWGSRYLVAKKLGKKEAIMYYYETLEHAASSGDVDFFTQILKEVGPDPGDE